MMAGLQRSAVSFRRQGSSGLVWNDNLNQLINQQNQDKDCKTDQIERKKDAVVGLRIERSRSTGGEKGFRSGKAAPSVEPPSPKVSACGFCGAFGKRQKNRNPQPRRSGKRGM